MRLIPAESLGDGAVVAVDEWVLSPDGRFRVCFTDIGEGVCGEFDESDPGDEPLLRLDIQSNDPDQVACEDLANFDESDDVDRGWFWTANGSYCTNVNADVVTGEQVARLLRRAALELDGMTGSIKRPAEEMSWWDANSAD